MKKGNKRYLLQLFAFAKNGPLEPIIISSATTSLRFEFLGPIPEKFMVGAVGHFTLQPIAHTNHKFLWVW